MQHGVYTIHDNKAQAFLPPFYAKTDGEAIRMFQDTCGDANTLFHRHAHDFHLYRLGAFNDITGELTNMDPPEMLLSAVNAIGPVGPVEAATERYPLPRGEFPGNGAYEGQGPSEGYE